MSWRASVAQYVIWGRRLHDAGVPNRSILYGAALGVLGFLVVPVVGLFVGFVGGVFAAEWRRVGRRRAWPSTVHALKAVGLGILIELAGCLLAATAWVAGVLAT